MIGVGTAYALVGIKSKLLHAFISAAALGSLGTTVLIIYVMNVPINDAIQGAYVVAAVCTGALLGVASVIFKDATESLNCLLGGFCLAMWVLTLKDGGLLPETGPKVAFIISLTIGGFALYFTRWTRPSALIFCISVSGATAVVLGIDCFSRSGLKEFWAYIWSLNGDLFPLGADTYPVTKGMRVELAATVLIAVLGVVSQVRLWRVIKERRAKQEALRAESDRNLQDEEHTAGQRIEQANGRERREWERVYGNGTGPGSISGSADSGVGDMECEKKEHGNISSSSTEGPRSPAGERDEMTAIHFDENGNPLSPMPAATEAMISHRAHDGPITVRVAQDDVPPGGPGGEEDMDGTPARKSWMLGSQGGPYATTPAPAVVALPFTVVSPDHDEEERSSVATFADEDGDAPPGSKRTSMVNRLSASSSRLLRRLSQRSRGIDLEVGEIPGESREELVMSRQSRNDDNDSLAANLDDMSIDDSDAGTVRDGGIEEPDRDIEIYDRTPGNEQQQDAELGGGDGAQLPSSPTSPEVTAEATTRDGPNTSQEDGVGVVPPPESSATSGQLAKTEASATNSGTRDFTPVESGSSKGFDEPSRRPKSVASTNSLPVNLTPTNLPRSLSRVAMSYRTNEWAKHLSFAETPEPDKLQLDEDPEVSSEATSVEEEPAPLNIEELQQTAETATPPPAISRSVSMMSSYSTGQLLPRNNSRSSLYLPASNPDSSRAVSGNVNRRTSVIYAQPIAEEGDGEVPSTPVTTDNVESPQPSTESSPAQFDPTASTSSLPSRPPVPGVVSYSSPQTLIGMREMFLRSKSQVSFYLPGAIPEPAVINSRRSSEAGSMYNYPMYPAAASAAASGVSLDDMDADDLPLSQRRDLMRRASAISWQPNGSATMLAGGGGGGLGIVSTPTAEAVPFNSHQPQRADPNNTLTPAARQARLASFRNSVAADLRAGPAIFNSPSGRSVYGGSAPNLLGRDGEVRRTVDAQRDVLLGQREAEAQRREAKRVEKERAERMFEQRMRSGDLMAAHREAMRRMQGGVKG